MVIGEANGGKLMGLTFLSKEDVASHMIRLVRNSHEVGSSLAHSVQGGYCFFFKRDKDLNLSLYFYEWSKFTINPLISSILPLNF